MNTKMLLASNTANHEKLHGKGKLPQNMPPRQCENWMHTVQSLTGHMYAPI